MQSSECNRNMGVEIGVSDKMMGQKPTSLYYTAMGVTSEQAMTASGKRAPERCGNDKVMDWVD